MFLATSFRKIIISTLDELSSTRESKWKSLRLFPLKLKDNFLNAFEDYKIIKRYPNLGTGTFHWNGSVSDREYILSGFNSPRTIISTFVNKDWDWLPVNGKVVVDIGGYIGDTAIYFISKGADSVVVYEAFPYSYDKLKNNVIQNNLSGKIQIHNAIIGSDSEYLVLSPEFENDNESQVARSHGSGIKVPAISLESIAEEIGSRDAVLKMNCEGCEYKAILNSAIGTLRVFSHIQMHYHGKLEPLVERLKLEGFLIEADEYIYATKI